MKQIKVNPNNEQYYSKEFVRGFNLGAQRQFEADKADRPQGKNLSEEYPSLFDCSVCGASCFDTIPWDCNINFCPNCGTRMKGADDE